MNDRNGCQLNRKGNMRKLYKIIMKLCDWKLILMIEVIYYII
uniref:ORF41k n=1 Tax=Pinus koraiensis TaxID=88728 RepID=A4QM77_PINKO|nr:ORF41k [Pinus koraiensis]